MSGDIRGVQDPFNVTGWRDGQQKSDSNTSPWGPQQEYLLGSFSEAARLYQQPIQYYQGDTIAGFSPEQQQAMSMASDRARRGSPLTGASQQYVYDATQGKYLPGNFSDYMNEYMTENPYLQYYTQRGFEEALPAMDSNAMAQGRYGGSTWGEMRGRAIGDIQSQIYGGAYQQERQNYEQRLEAERQRQTSAAAMGPEMAKADYYDIGQLAAVGEQRQAMDQAQKDAAVKKWEFEQMEPWERLSMYINSVTGDYGGSTSSTASKKK